MANDSTGAKHRLSELEILRAICIAAVVLIHGTSTPVGDLPPGGLKWTFFFIVNKANHFTVPVFLFISGLVLAYRYYDTWNIRQAPTFYAKRFKQVLIPYLFWSLFFYITPQLYTNPNVFTVNIRGFLHLLRWGDASYHLYFMIIIMQFYLLFPFLLSLVRKLRLTGIRLFVFGLAVHAAYYYVEFYVHSFGHRASVCFNYFTILIFGMAAGIGYDKFRRTSERYVWALSGIAVLFGAWFVGMYLMNAWYGTRFHNTLFEISFYGYAATVASAGIGLASRWSGRPGWLYRLTARAGAASFGIYLMHPAWLTFWHQKIRFPHWRGMYEAYQLGAIIWSFAGSWLVVLLYAYWKKGTFPWKPSPRTATAPFGTGKQASRM